MNATLIENLKQETLHKQRVDPYDLLIFMSEEPALARSRDIDELMRHYSDDELFYIYTLAREPATEVLRATGDEVKERYIETCLKKGYADRRVFSMMYGKRSMDEIANFCVECGYSSFLNHVQHRDVVGLTYNQFNSFYDAIRKAPTYNSAKAFMLSRNDLTTEQKIYGVKNLANCGCPLPEPYFVNLEELNALPIKTLIKLIEDRICHKYKDEIRFHPDVKMKQVKKLLFPLMMDDERRYSNIIKTLKGDNGE